MIEIDDIVDQKSLNKWLLAQPEKQIQHFAVVISSRVAHRFVPQMWRWTQTSEYALKRVVTALPYLRCNVVAVVACDNLILASAASATEAASALAPDDINVPAVDIIHTNAYSFGADDVSFAAKDASAFASVAASSVAFASSSAALITALAASNLPLDIWAEIRSDCQVLLDEEIPKIWPLWQDGADPFADVWGEVNTALGDDTKDWQFWIEWYQAMLHGTPQNWNMLEEIALIDDAVWKDGFAAVNKAIADIQLKYTLKSTPNAEVMSVNPDTHKLRVDPVSDMPRDHLQEAVEKLENVLALFDFEQGISNQHQPIKQEWQIIKTAVQRYGSKPRMLYSACVNVERRLKNKIRNGVCPEPEKDADIEDLLITVGSVAVDLLERDTLVKEAATFTAAIKLPDLSEELVDTLFKAASEIEERAEDDLQAEIVARVRDIFDKTLPEAERKEAFYITASRMLRAWVLTGYKGSKATLAEVEGITKTIAGIAGSITKISASGAALSSPLWLEKAVEILQRLLT